MRLDILGAEGLLYEFSALLIWFLSDNGLDFSSVFRSSDEH